ncbi:MAG: glycosyltransferase [Deltaproteobacteria bacterium]|nr:glycosyltransferase [Deltaproteobacteria bacterium]
MLAHASDKTFLVFPCYNPCESEWRALDAFIGELKRKTSCAFEFLVVDDGSPRWVPPAPELLARFRLHRLPRNLGKGGALKEAAHLTPSDASVFAFVDFDLPYSVDDVLGVCSAVHAGVDVCIGDRTLYAVSGANVSDRASRKLSHKIFRLFVRMIITGGIPDTQCGLKAYYAPAARRIAVRARLAGFLFDIEWIYIALRHRLAVRCWPVKVAEGHESSPLRSFGPWKLLMQLVKLVKGILRRDYDDEALYAVAEERRASVARALLTHAS